MKSFINTTAISVAASQPFLQHDSDVQEATEERFTACMADTFRIRREMEPVKEGGIVDNLRKDRRFSKLVRILEENTGLRDDLDRPNRKITLLAPTNEAFDFLEEAMSAIRERNREEGVDRSERENMEQVVRYHIVQERIEMKNVFQGMLLPTALKVNQLNGKNQMIRVSKYMGDYFANMYARMCETNIRTENATVFALHRVLCVPENAAEMMGLASVLLSTTLVGAGITGIVKQLEKNKGITVLAPDNHAWKALGPENVAYLFSPKGRNDLKRILEYHVCTDLAYSVNMMENKTIKLRSLLEDQQIEICAAKRQEHEKESTQRPGCYIFTINKGEGRITCTDFVCENGVIQPITNVLIPKNVKLPVEVQRQAPQRA